MTNERPTGAMISTRLMAERWHVSLRTVERWIEVGVLPPPIRVRGRKYWPEGTAPAREAAGEAA